MDTFFFAPVHKILLIDLRIFFSPGPRKITAIRLDRSMCSLMFVLKAKKFTGYCPLVEYLLLRQLITIININSKLRACRNLVVFIVRFYSPQKTQNCSNMKRILVVLNSCTVYSMNAKVQTPVIPLKQS
jgi:hypothetical protein